MNILRSHIQYKEKQEAVEFHSFFKKGDKLWQKAVKGLIVNTDYCEQEKQREKTDIIFIGGLPEMEAT